MGQNRYFFDPMPKNANAKNVNCHFWCVGSWKMVTRLLEHCFIFSLEGDNVPTFYIKMFRNKELRELETLREHKASESVLKRITLINQLEGPYLLYSCVFIIKQCLERNFQYNECYCISFIYDTGDIHQETYFFEFILLLEVLTRITSIV